ncbi:hypothetical protein B0J14DRAFT_161458 [Halenospora varia]|nr:hypothetical protein B0J14DRAFT_161458 [Halenospora varia]
MGVVQRNILPSEIRIKIRGIALSIPRNVTVDCQRGVRSFSPSEPPALLQVCRESRFESLQIYRPFFRTDSRLKNIYVAFSQDTIITSETFDGMWKAELQGIQKMKIKISSTHRFFPFGITALKEMQRDLELVFEQGVLYSRYGSPFQIVMDAICSGIAQGWDCCPDMKVVNGQTGEIVVLDGVSVMVPITATINPLL